MSRNHRRREEEKAELITTNRQGKVFIRIPPSIDENTEVDIVTPVYGSPKFLRLMLESILSYDAGAPWRLTLVDDLGPDREETDRVYSEFSGLKRIRLIRNVSNSGFAACNNKGFRQGVAPLLLMLNSDVIVCEDGWLKQMSDEFVKDVWVGVVGARLLYFEKEMMEKLGIDGEEQGLRSPGSVQHAGVAFNLMGQPYHVFMYWSAESPKIMQRREMNAMTGACLMTRRDLYGVIGGLDEQYRTGNFEDVQYCLQCRSLGRRVVYQPKAKLYHFSGGSNNSATAILNEQLFRLKCKDLLEYDEWRYW